MGSLCLDPVLGSLQGHSRCVSHHALKRALASEADMSKRENDVGLKYVVSNNLSRGTGFFLLFLSRRAKCNHFHHFLTFQAALICTVT